MRLKPRNEVVVNNQADTDRHVTHSIKKITAADRKNIKVNPKTLKLIKFIVNNGDTNLKIYSLIDKAIESYVENEMNPREKKMINNYIRELENS